MYFLSRLHNFYSLSQSHTIHDKKNYYPDLRYTVGHLAWLLALTHLLQPLLLHHESQCIQANNPTFPSLILQPNQQSINFSHPISPFLCSTNKLNEKKHHLTPYIVYIPLITSHFSFRLPLHFFCFVVMHDDGESLFCIHWNYMKAVKERKKKRVPFCLLHVSFTIIVIHLLRVFCACSKGKSFPGKPIDGKELACLIFNYNAFTIASRPCHAILFIT